MKRYYQLLDEIISTSIKDFINAAARWGIDSTVKTLVDRKARDAAVRET